MSMVVSELLPEENGHQKEALVPGVVVRRVTLEVTTREVPAHHVVVGPVQTIVLGDQVRRVAHAMQQRSRLGVTHMPTHK